MTKGSTGSYITGDGANTMRREALAVMALWPVQALATSSVLRSRKPLYWYPQKTAHADVERPALTKISSSTNVVFHKGALIAQKPQAVLG